MPVKKEISLLPDENNNYSLGARILRYLTTVGRVIIIVTELIVIGAFISRFWLDRQNSDLSETIRQQKAILESTQQFEKDFNLLSQKVANIKSISQSKTDFNPNLVSLANSTPSDIIFKNLSLNRDKKGNTTANLEIIAYQETSLVDFITNLTVNPDIKSVEINTIEKKLNDNKYTLNLIINFTTVKT